MQCILYTDQIAADESRTLRTGFAERIQKWRWLGFALFEILFP